MNETGIAFSDAQQAALWLAPISPLPLVRTKGMTTPPTPKPLSLGTYRLPLGLHNAQGDHRTRRDWRTEKSFAKDSVYYVDQYFGASDGTLSIRRAGSPLDQVVIEGDDRFAVLARYLQRQPTKPSAWLRRQDKGGLAMSILDKLVAQGRLTQSDIETACTDDLEYLPNL